MLPDTNHSFWKEVIMKHDKLVDQWSKLKKENKEPGQMRYEKLRKGMPCGSVSTLNMMNRAGGDIKMPNRCPVAKMLRSKRKTEAQKVLCKQCQRAEVDAPNSRESEKCQRCKGVVTYLCYRCCECGYVPFDPMMFYDPRTISSDQEFMDSDTDELVDFYKNDFDNKLK